MKSKLKVILPVLLISSSAFVLFQLKKESTLININTNSQNSSSINSDKISTPISFQKLSILSNRCIGCGKCTRIDSTHFNMNGNVAIVVSSTNLNSSNLKLAINNCPTQAITLE